MRPRLKKVLIVEDSELLHRMYDLIFLRYKNEQTKVLHSFNGKHGLEKLAAHPDCDLILLDINMPIMSGLEFLHNMMREEAYRSIPVIIISTEGKEEDTLRGLDAGARAYLTKPFQPGELHDLIARIFSEPAARTAAQGA